MGKRSPYGEAISIWGSDLQMGKRSPYGEAISKWRSGSRSGNPYEPCRPRLIPRARVALPRSPRMASRRAQAELVICIVFAAGGAQRGAKKLSGHV